MPHYQFAVSVPPNAAVFPLATWQYRLPPRPATVELMVGAAATGVVMSFTTGPESIVQADTVVGAGLTANSLPARLNFEVIQDAVLGQEELVLQLRNTTGGAIVCGGVLVMTYL